MYYYVCFQASSISLFVTQIGFWRLVSLYSSMELCTYAMGLIPSNENFVIDFCIRQINNFFGDVFLWYIIGMMFVKIDIFSRIKYLGQHIWKDSHIRIVCFRLILLLCLSAVIYILEKAIFMPFYAAFIFCFLTVVEWVRMCRSISCF